MLGLGFAELMSPGSLPREKNQMLICELVHSIAYVPPLAELKPLP